MDYLSDNIGVDIIVMFLSELLHTLLERLRKRGSGTSWSLRGIAGWTGERQESFRTAGITLRDISNGEMGGGGARWVG